MAIDSRKIAVTMLALAFSVGLFILVNRLSDTPAIRIDRIRDSNDPNLEFDPRNVGEVGDVGVGKIERAVFTDLNKETKEIERQFGFDSVLNEQGEEWEFEKPFMTLFRPGFKCMITADKGKIFLESGLKDPNPQNGTLYENVKIRIVPDEDSELKPSCLSLDEVMFSSEQSRITSEGAIEFVSEDVNISGRNLEIVYNETKGRLEFMKINKLDEIRIKNSVQGLFGSETKNTSARNSQPVIDEPETSNTNEQLYRCVFEKDVSIDTPEQLVLADAISISNITFGSSKKNNADKPENKTASGTIDASTDAVNTFEPNQFISEADDIVVTCAGSIIVTPMDKITDDFSLLQSSASQDKQKAIEIRDLKNKPVLISKMIDYDLQSDETSATGPIEVAFYANNVFSQEDQSQKSPVMVNASKSAKFIPDENRIEMVGDCTCLAVATEQLQKIEYRISADTFDLIASSMDTNSTAKLEKFTATGEVVRLSSIKKDDANKQIGGMELKCTKLVSDNLNGEFSAYGPGMLKLDNSKASPVKEKPARLNLQQPCWAFLENFESLKYFSKNNKLIAQAPDEKTLIIKYLPITKDGQYGKLSTATAGHVEANFIDVADNKIELLNLHATKTISYEEKDIRLDGSEMFYDAAKSLITVPGTVDNPCLFNGNSFGKVEFNLDTGKVSTEVLAPGTF